MRIAICDDEEIHRDAVEKLLMANMDTNIHIVWESFRSGEELLRRCREGASFDIVFLDIEMGEMTGLEAAEELFSHNKDTIVFFVTSHINYVSDTFRLNAFQFLIKPVDPEVFKQDFERAIRTYVAKHKNYLIKWRDKQTHLEYKDIIFIETKGKHILIHTQKKSYECVGKISEEAKRLKNFGFVQTHQSYLINVAYMKSIEKTEVVLFDGRRLLLSRQRRKETVHAFNKFLIGHHI